MKRLLLSVAFLSVMSLSYGQSTIFKPFKVDLGVGYGFGNAKGVTFHLEPKYSIKDQIAIGLRMEGALLGNVEMEDGGNGATSVDISAIASYLVTGDYYFSNNTFRPLVGLGAGVYNMGSVGITTTDNQANIDEPVVEVGTKFGIAPRIGFEAGHFRMGLEYNIITGQPKDFNRNYFAAKIGVVFGGGRR